MRMRILIIITIFLALLYSALIHRPSAPCLSKSDLPKDLNKYYDGSNSEFFDGKLPKDVIIDWGEYDIDKMASVTKLPSGKFHIAFNERYSAADRVARMTLLHEECHIATWDELAKNQHGPRWRTCMLNLYQVGAFKKDLIDGHDE